MSDWSDAINKAASAECPECHKRGLLGEFIGGEGRNIGRWIAVCPHCGYRGSAYYDAQIKQLINVGPRERFLEDDTDNLLCALGHLLNACHSGPARGFARSIITLTQAARASKAETKEPFASTYPRMKPHLVSWKGEVAEMVKFNLEEFAKLCLEDGYEL